MGNAYLYWYEEPRAAVSTLDLGGGLEDLIAESVPQGALEEGLGGHIWPTPLGHYEVIEAILPGIVTAATWRVLRRLERVMDRGGLVGISADHGKSFAAKITGGSTSRGATSLTVGPNIFSGWSASAALASGDQVVIESAWPECQWHLTTLSGSLAATGGTASLTDALPADMRQGPYTLRFADFYPLVSKRGDAPLVTHLPGRLVYTLRLTARTANKAYFAALGRGIPLRGSTANDGKINTWDLLGYQLEGGDDGMGRPGGMSGGLFGLGGTGGKG